MEPHGNDFKPYGPIGPVVNGRELVGFYKAGDNGAIREFVRAIRRTVEAQHVGPHGADLDYWWRHLSEVAPGLIVTGCFPSDPEEAQAQLERWVAWKVTHVLDCRIENDDRRFIGKHAPRVIYERLGVDDDGAPREDEWFDEGVAFARRAAESDGTLLVYCQMGVNRSPSMAYRILLDRGVPFEEAFVDIAAKRPIVRLGYAVDAVAHYAAVSGWSQSQTEQATGRVDEILDVEPARMWAAANLPGEVAPW